MTKTYCDICGKEIAKEEKTCDMCFVINSYAEDQDLFNYNLNEISEEEFQEKPSDYELTTPEPGKNYCAFCGWEMPMEESGNCEECTLQAARERDIKDLGYVSCQYDFTFFDEDPPSPSAQETEFVDMAEDEEEEDPEEEEWEEEENL